MEALYPIIKHIHMLIISLSIVLFNVRVWLLAARPDKKLPTVWKILPHINDTLLLFSGMMMMAIVKWQPFGAHKWLGMKLVLLLVYIGFGIVCIRSQPRSGKFWVAYGLALLAVASIVYLARFKPF